jgi:Tfp pilus assembly protein PilO
MSVNDRTLLLVIPVIAALLAFWFLAISPKRDEAKKLEEQITTLEASVQEQEAASQAGLQARKSFPNAYHRMVVMGKAVPVGDETASLLVQVNRIAGDAGISFRSIKASEGGDAAAAAAPPAPAPATEGAAALLPIGATVGSAGLPTLPYELIFRGTFFQIADFMAGIDRLVDPRRNTIAANGRLVTVDGFTLTADDTLPYPVLKATMQATTYVTPADQGLTAGATPAGPSPAPAATPAAATTATTP